MGCCMFSINPSEVQLYLVKSKAHKQVRSAVPMLCLDRILDKEIRGRHMSDSGEPQTMLKECFPSSFLLLKRHRLVTETIVGCFPK